MENNIFKFDNKTVEYNGDIIGIDILKNIIKMININIIENINILIKGD